MLQWPTHCLLVKEVHDGFLVVETNEKGRHCVAAQDIQPGQVILRTEPFGCVPAENYLPTICSTCFGRIDQRSTQDEPALGEAFGFIARMEDGSLESPRSCDACCQALYCSQYCLEKDLFWHSRECVLLQHLRKTVEWLEGDEKEIDIAEDEIIPTTSIRGSTTELRLILRMLNRISYILENGKLSPENVPSSPAALEPLTIIRLTEIAANLPIEEDKEMFDRGELWYKLFPVFDLQTSIHQFPPRLLKTLYDKVSLFIHLSLHSSTAGRGRSGIEQSKLERLKQVMVELWLRCRINGFQVSVSH